MEREGWRVGETERFRKVAGMSVVAAGSSMFSPTVVSESLVVNPFFPAVVSESLVVNPFSPAVVSESLVVNPFLPCSSIRVTSC